jgi:hypothetical protein
VFTGDAARSFADRPPDSGICHVNGPKPREVATAYGLEWLALAANRDGRKEEAIDLFRQAIETMPGHYPI